MTPHRRSPGDATAESLPAADTPEQEADYAPLGRSADKSTASGDDDPYLGDSVLAQEVFDRATSAAEGNNEKDAVALFLRAAKLAEQSREWYLAGLALTRVGDFLQHPKPPSDLERAFRMYRRAAAAFEACGHFGEARELSYRLMRLKLHRASELGLSGWTRLELAGYWLLAGFGYRPLWLIGQAVLVVVAYAAIYWAAEGLTLADGRPASSFDQALYFSGITFATVGYGDILPAPHMRLVALSEGAIGLFTMSFFVVVLANRLRH